MVNGYEIIINQNTAAVLAEAQGVETDELLNQTLFRFASEVLNITQI